MNMRWRVLMSLIDGEKHPLGDIQDYVKEAVDPRMAVRCYLTGWNRCKNPQEIPLDEQVKIGTKRLMAQCLAHMILLGSIETDHVRDEDWLPTDRLWLTEKGKEKIRDKMSSTRAGEVCREISRLWQEGKMVIKMVKEDER